MKKREKLTLHDVTVLSKKEMENVTGGYAYSEDDKKPCDGKKQNESCDHPKGGSGTCISWPFTSGLVCMKN